jgi:hypothetical protein
MAMRTKMHPLQINRRSKRVAGGDQPVSVSSCGLACEEAHNSSSSHSRYGIQAAALESMAAYSDSKDRLAYIVHNSHSLWPHRWTTDLGKQSRMSACFMSTQ